MSFVSKGKASPPLMRELNRNLILQELRSHPYQSRAALAKKTKLSRPSVSELVKEMIREGMVREVGVGNSTSNGGRKPILLEYNAQSNYVAGAILQDDSLKVTIADMDGKLIKTDAEAVHLPISENEIIRMVDSILTKILSSISVSKNQISGLVVGVPGITAESGRGIRFSPGVSWSDNDVAREFEESIGVPVVIDNDVNLMTLGEFYKGLGASFQNTIYLFAGNGIGSGIILNGEFIRGSHMAAGEIGYMLIGNPLYKNFDMGVFESNYGTNGLLQKMTQLGLPVDSSQKAVKQLQALSLQDSSAGELLNEFLDSWTKAIVNLACMLDPELIVLSGEMSDLHDKHLEKLKSSIERYIPKAPSILLTSLGSKAGLYGAIHLALEEFTQFGYQNRS